MKERVMDNQFYNSEKTKKGTIYSIFLIGALLFIIYYLCSGMLWGFSIKNVIKICLMNIFGVFLPGVALFTLFAVEGVNLIGAITISYALGYIYNILSYFIFVPFGAGSLIPLYVFGGAIISFFFLSVNRYKVEIKSLSREDVPFVVLFFIYMILNTIAYAGCNVLPTITNAVSYPTDLLYWIENAAALTKEFPACDPRVNLNETLYYHYFSSIQIAFLNLATGLDIFSLGVSFYSIGKSLLFYGSFYLLLGNLVNNKRLVLGGLIVICFCTGFEGLVAAGLTYIAHTWTHPFGFDIGFAMGALFLYFLIMQYRKREFDVRLWLLTILSFAVCAGLKIPIAVIVIIVAGIICFWWLRNRKFDCAFAYGMGVLVSFFVIAIGCAGLGIQSGQTGIISFSHFISSSTILSMIYELWGNRGGKIFIKILCVLLYCALVHPIFFALNFASFISILVNKEMRNSLNISLLISGMFGIILGIINVQPGQSQAYFTMAAFIPGIALSVIWLDNRVLAFTYNKKMCIKAGCGLLIFIQMCFGLFYRYTYWGSGLISSFRVGIDNISGGEYSRKNELEHSDWEALNWIRENTPKDSIVLSDRSILGEEMRYYMYYGAFSERQMYIEGDVYFRERYVTEREELATTVKEVYMNSDEALKKAISDGVDYIVQTKWLTPDFKPNDIITELVYESDTISVYEIRD